MASIKTLVLEFRSTTGYALNGGGFDTASTGTDYSNQDSQQLGLTDLTSSGAGVVTVTSALTTFDATHVGNLLNLASGTNVTASFYRIVSFDSSSGSVDLDRAPDDDIGGISDGVGRVGGALDIPTDAMIENTDLVIPGVILYLRAGGQGAYVLAAISTGRDGDITNKIKWWGYDTDRTVEPKGDNRPLIDTNTQFNFDNFWEFRNLRINTSYNYGLSPDSYTFVINCKIHNDSTYSGRTALYTSAANYYSRCEMSSANGQACFSNVGSLFEDCYFHDATDGVTFSGGGGGGDYMNYIRCVFDTLSGDALADTYAGAIQHRVLDCTFYDCATAVDLDTLSNGWVFERCIFDGTGNGIDIAADASSTRIEWCCFNLSGTDVVNVTKGATCIDVDPLMTDPANGDFSISASSPCHQVAPGGANVGLAVAMNSLLNIGADQRTYPKAIKPQMATVQ
jgi:hypothetical protein